MTGNESNKLVKGAFLLTVAGVVSKILSAGYRIPLQNLTGDLGFYMYQQIYPLLGMILTLSLYGFPTAVSKLSSERKALDKGRSLKSFYGPVFSILLGINGIIFVLVFYFSETMATFIGDERLTNIYQSASFLFLLIPFTVLLRGVFQGNLDMKPIAYAQVGEQFVRVSIIIFAAYLFFVNKIPLVGIGYMAVLASLGGTVIATLMLGFYFIKQKPISSESYEVPWSHYIRTICFFGIVASMNHMVLLLIQTADVFTLVPNLIEYGLTETEAMAAKGILDRGQPLIQLGTVLGSSFALSLIPMITSNRSALKSPVVARQMHLAINVTFYLATGAVLGLVVIFPEVNVLLFQDMKGTSSLQVLACSILLSSLAITLSAILQGLGFYKRTALFIVGAFLVKWLANRLFVPIWGIQGGALATVFSLLLLTVVLIFVVKRKIEHMKFFETINWKGLLLAGSGMLIFLFAVKFFVPLTIQDSRLMLLVHVLFMSVFGAVIFIIILLRTKTFTRRDIAMLPFSNLLFKLYKERD